MVVDLLIWHGSMLAEGSQGGCTADGSINCACNGGLLADLNAATDTMAGGGRMHAAAVETGCVHDLADEIVGGVNRAPASGVATNGVGIGKDRSGTGP